MDDSVKAVQEQHDVIGNCAELKGLLPNSHPGAQWFLKGGNLGMFIHWGISSVDGNIDISWPMLAGKPWDKEGYKNTVTADYYFSLAEKFKPLNCNFDKMISAAARCGHNYAVLTARHHEGFALWPSKYGNFNTKNYMGGIDLVKRFVESCHKYGLRVGLYYSPPDWYRNQKYMSFHYNSRTSLYPDRPHYDIYHHEIPELPKKPDNWEMEEAEYVSGQIRELLTGYGKIDILWFDGSIPLYENAISIDEIRELQPSIVVTSRMHRQGDFLEYELSFPEEMPKLPWEYGATWTEFNWGYCEQCLDTYRSAEWAVDLYCRVREWNGNLLLNVTPDKEGNLPEISYEQYRRMEKLMKERGLLI